MNSNIINGKREYDEKNYGEALKYFDRVSSSDEDYSYMLIYKINSLMELEEYEKCLKLLNSLIEDMPYDRLLWYEKIRCHIFLKQEKNAFRSLSEFERLIDEDDKYFTLSVAKFYDVLGDSESALKFCNRALEIDENYEEALQQKAQIACLNKNEDLMMECSEKLIELAKGDIIKLMLPFLLNLFSGNYIRAYEIIPMMDEIDDEHSELLKSAIYQHMVDDLKLEIRLTSPAEWHVDDALKLLFKYKYEGIEAGIFKGVGYFIV